LFLNIWAATRLEMGRIGYKGGIPPYSTLLPYKH